MQAYQACSVLSDFALRIGSAYLTLTLLGIPNLSSSKYKKAVLTQGTTA